MIHMSFTVKTMASDVTTTEGASSSAAMVYICFSRNIPASAPVDPTWISNYIHYDMWN